MFITFFICVEYELVTVNDCPSNGDESIVIFLILSVSPTKVLDILSTAFSGVFETLFIIPVDLSTSGDDLRIILPRFPNRLFLNGSRFLLLLFLNIASDLPTSFLSDSVKPVGWPSSGVGAGGSICEPCNLFILNEPDTSYEELGAISCTKPFTISFTVNLGCL